MNKKIASEITIGTLLLLAIVIGGIFWLQDKKETAIYVQAQPTVTKNQQQINSGENLNNTSTQDTIISTAGECDNFIKDGRDEPTPEEEIQCKKELSVPDKDGYSRYSYFPTKMTVSGEYRKTLSLNENDFPILGFGTICFTVSEKDFKKIPNDSNYGDRDTFCFINVEDAEKAFGTGKQLFDENKNESCELFGEATIEISDYFIDKFESDVNTNIAKLERIINKEPFKIECQ